MAGRDKNSELERIWKEEVALPRNAKKPLSQNSRSVSKFEPGMCLIKGEAISTPL
jgi:hypothetical protein